jgi:hypothetical protein
VGIKYGLTRQWIDRQFERRRLTGSLPDVRSAVTLTVDTISTIDGHRCVRWSPDSRATIRACQRALQAALADTLSLRCTHVKGHGGLKGAVRWAHGRSARMPFVARFDIQSYYDNLDHGVLLRQLDEARVDAWLIATVAAYLRLPDQARSGRGMTSGGALSPLLGAVYLTPLDQAMEALERQGIGYPRFMDDFVIFAPARHKLRAAIRRMYAVLDQLKLRVHPEKRFIGRTASGFVFLGYRLRTGAKLRPAQLTIDRLITRARRLQERGAGEGQLRRYVWRWYKWLLGGLRGRVSTKGRFTRIWVLVLKRLYLTDQSVHPR